MGLLIALFQRRESKLSGLKLEIILFIVSNRLTQLGFSKKGATKPELIIPLKGGVRVREDYSGVIKAMDSSPFCGCELVLPNGDGFPLLFTSDVQRSECLEAVKKNIPQFRLEEHYHVKSRVACSCSEITYTAETLEGEKEVEITEVMKPSGRPQELKALREKMENLKLVRHPLIPRLIAIH